MPDGGAQDGQGVGRGRARRRAAGSGRDRAAGLDRPGTVDRDVRRGGRRYSGTELFCAARFGGERPAVSRSGLLPHERASLEGCAWVPWPDLGWPPGRVEPPHLLSVLAALLPDGPWG
ncbi:NUDIX hydrolase, partial [Streptomyces chitinivorans]